MFSLHSSVYPRGRHPTYTCHFQSSVFSLPLAYTCTPFCCKQYALWIINYVKMFSLQSTLHVHKPIWQCNVQSSVFSLPLRYIPYLCILFSVFSLQSTLSIDTLVLWIVSIINFKLCKNVQPSVYPRNRHLTYSCHFLPAVFSLQSTLQIHTMLFSVFSLQSTLVMDNLLYFCGHCHLMNINECSSLQSTLEVHTLHGNGMFSLQSSVYPSCTHPTWQCHVQSSVFSLPSR